jgi:hypothetical protein
MTWEVGNHLRIKIDDQFGYWRAENEELRFEGFEGFVVCPKPELVCGMKAFLGRNAMVNVATVTPPSTLSLNQVKRLRANRHGRNVRRQQSHVQR